MMHLRIAKDTDGQLYLERGDFRCDKLYRRSEFLDGQSDDSIEGMGYCAVEKQYPGNDIEGYAEIGETLYIVTPAPYVR